MQVMGPEHHRERWKRVGHRTWATKTSDLLFEGKAKQGTELCCGHNNICHGETGFDKLTWSFHVVKVSVLSVGLYLDHFLPLF